MSTTARGRRGALAPRAVRMRNACVRHAADRLGLEQPSDADLRALGDDTTLSDAVEWWQARAAGAESVPAAGPAPARVPFAVRAAVAAAVTVVGLALSFGRAQ